MNRVRRISILEKIQGLNKSGDLKQLQIHEPIQLKHETNDNTGKY